MLIKAAWKRIEYEINYECFFFLFFYFPDATHDSDFRNRRIVAVVEGSIEVLVKSCVISPYHLFARSHENHAAATKSN